MIKMIKNALKWHTIQTISVSVIIYLIIAFVTWEFFNPFQWIIDMPTYSSVIRFHILFLVLSYNVISIGSRCRLFFE